MRTGLKCLVIAFILWSSSVHAEIYKWEDKDGNMHLTDEQPQGDAAGRVTRIETAESQHYSEGETAPGGKTVKSASRSSGDRTSKQAATEPTAPAVEPKLYTDEQRDRAIQMLEKQINTARTTCSTKHQNNGKDQAWWDQLCENDAQTHQRALDILLSEPNRYFYVINASNEKRASGGGSGANPRYLPWDRASRY